MFISPPPKSCLHFAPGSIPSERGKLAALTVLNLWRNQLTGEFQFRDESRVCSSVLEAGGHMHFLSRNPNPVFPLALAGHIPPELGALRELEGLYLKDNNLTGTK